MKNALLFLLFGVICLAFVSTTNAGHPHGRQTRGFADRIQRLRSKLEKLKKRIGSAAEGAIQSYKRRKNKFSNIFANLKACSGQCSSNCSQEFSTCKQSCSGTCQDVRVPWLCQRNCYANQCETGTCFACFKSCVTTRTECRNANCRLACASRRKRMQVQCERCMTESCPVNGVGPRPAPMPVPGEGTEVDPEFGRNLPGTNQPDIDPQFGRNPPSRVEVDPGFSRELPGIDPQFGRELPSETFLQAMEDVIGGNE